jgi:hypothetical protein
MHTEKISVRVTQTGQTMEVVVFDKRADHITVVLVGSVMGREIVYEHSRTQVQADLDRDNPALRQSTRRKR